MERPPRIMLLLGEREEAAKRPLAFFQASEPREESCPSLVPQRKFRELIV
jgi:hypothetical protein